MKIPIYAGNSRRIRKCERLLIKMMDKKKEKEKEDALEYLRKEISGRDKIKRIIDEIESLDKELLKHRDGLSDVSEYNLRSKSLDFDNRDYGIEYLTTITLQNEQDSLC